MTRDMIKTFFIMFTKVEGKDGINNQSYDKAQSSMQNIN